MCGKKIFAIILGSLLLIHCSKEEPFVPRFSVDVIADSFDAAGGSKTIALTANMSWTASSNQDWLTVTPTTGNGGTTIILTASENSTPANRTAEVTLIPLEGDMIKINITQSTSYQFYVNTLTVVLEIGQEEASVILSSKTGWQVASSEEWLTIIPERGTGDEELKLNVSLNESSRDRTAIVTITPDSGNPIEIEVLQKGVLLSVDTRSVSFDPAPQEKTIALQSNIPWVATTSDEWLTVTPQEGPDGKDQPLLIAVTRNSTADERAATLIITPELGEPIEIEVLQEGTGYASTSTRYVAPEPLGNGSGDSEINAADFLAANFWAGINTELKSNSVEVLFLDGDYRRAYTSPGTHGLRLERIGHENNRLTMTGGRNVIFTVPEGYATTSNLIYFHGCQNIHFRDFNFTGNGGINYVLAIRTPAGFPSSKNILVENCTWTDMLGIVYGATGCHYEGTTNITYKNCTFKRIGAGAGAHMMYHAYGPTNISVVDCYFEDCMGDYVRFRDRTDFGIVKDSRFLRNAAFPSVSFINIACYNDVDPGDEYFGTNFSFTGNTFDVNATTGNAILFRQRGYSPPDYNYLLTAAEAEIFKTGSRTDKMEQFKESFGIDFDKIRIVTNTYSYRITNHIAFYTAADYGASSRGFGGTFSIATDIPNNSVNPFEWESNIYMIPELSSTNLPGIIPEIW